MTKAAFEPIAPGIEWLPGGLVSPNVYLVNGVLIDGVPKPRTRRLLRALENCNVSANLLTHAHGPTQGSAAAVSAAFHIPVYCGYRDLLSLRTATFKYNYPPGFLNHAINWLSKGDPVDNAHGVSANSKIAGFQVVDTPGHSAGHISLWRADDGVLIGGDVIVTRGILRNSGALQPPPRAHTLDMELNNYSAAKLRELNPSALLPAHGKPTFDAQTIRDYCENLASQQFQNTAAIRQAR
ncbi:MBL fold metallo-hydrolase [Prescottella equi]